MRAEFWRGRRVVDDAVRAAKISAILDAVQRIREVLPETAKQFDEDRTAREIVILNLFVAIQAAIDLALHRVVDQGWPVPGTYSPAFLRLGEHGVIERDLAQRLFKAGGLRNLIARRYGEIDVDQLHAPASTDLEDLVAFCRALAR